MRLLVILLGMFLFTDAQASFALRFGISVRQELLPLRLDQFFDTAENISVAQPSILERYGFVNNEAAASYNGFLNTIVLKPDSLTKEDGKLRFATVGELQARHGHTALLRISQIFHEMAHAEYDVFVEKKQNEVDAALVRVFTDEVRPWLRRNHRISSFTINTTISEIFGYYRGDLLDLMFSDQGDIAVANGLNVAAGKCFFPKDIKAAALELPLEKFLEYLPIGASYDEAYKAKFRLSSVFVGGDEVSLKTVDPRDPYEPRWHEALWNHFHAYYGIPRSKREILQFMNRSPHWRNKIADCRKNYWLSVHTH